MPHTARRGASVCRFVCLLLPACFLAFGALSACSGRGEEGGAATPSLSMGSPKPSHVLSETPTAGKTFTVGVSLGAGGDLQRALQTAMEATARADDLTLDVQDAKQDAALQRQQVAGLIAHHVDAIVLCPIDTDTAGSAVQAANTAKVPVFTIAVRAQRGVVQAHIAPDETQGGGLAARELATLLKEKGTVVMFGATGLYRERAQGFHAEIGRHPGLKLLPDITVQGSRAALQTQAVAALKRPGPPINGIFGLDDTAALATLAACREAGRSDIVIVGFDGGPEARAAIKSGTNLKADTIAPPDKVGAHAIETVLDYLQRKTVAANVPVAYEILDAAHSAP